MKYFKDWLKTQENVPEQAERILSVCECFEEVGNTTKSNPNLTLLYQLATEFKKDGEKKQFGRNRYRDRPNRVQIGIGRYRSVAATRLTQDGLSDEIRLSDSCGLC